MEDFSKENGNQEKLMEKEGIFMKMVRFMKVNILMIKKKDLVFFILVNTKNILVNGKMISLMVMGL